MPTAPHTGDQPLTPEPLLLPGEVARLFRVDPKTVTSWANNGRLRCIRTPTGMRRYYQADVEAFLNAGGRP